jgi:hypothetical protein
VADEQPTKGSAYGQPAVVAAIIGLVGVIITAGVAVYVANRTDKNETTATTRPVDSKHVARLNPISTRTDELPRFVSVIGSGWTTEARVRVMFGDQSRRQDVDVNADGSFTASFLLIGLRPGTYDVRVDGLQTGRFTTAIFYIY